MRVETTYDANANIPPYMINWANWVEMFWRHHPIVTLDPGGIKDCEEQGKCRKMT